jgi:hypothetical protein
MRAGSAGQLHVEWPSCQINAMSPAAADLWQIRKLQGGSPGMQPTGGPVGSGMVPDAALYGGGFAGDSFGGSADGFGPGPGMLPGFVPQVWRTLSAQHQTMSDFRHSS